MALKLYLLFTLILISIVSSLLEVSSASTWNPNIHRYESYDLEKGPVFYEAYYPDTSEETSNNFQEKRYFDHGAVLEKTYQIPSKRFLYPDDTLRVDNYQNGAERYQYPDEYVDPGPLSVESERRSVPLNYNTRRNIFLRKRDSSLQDTRENHFFDEPNDESLDVKKIANIARRAISRDLENWNTLESYLDRAKYQDSMYHQPLYPYNTEELKREIETLEDSLKEERNLRKGLYTQIEEAELRNRIPSVEDQNKGVKRLTQRDLGSRNSLGTFNKLQYNEKFHKEEIPVSQQSSEINGSLKKDDSRDLTDSIVNRYPLENIFQPRPQIINYVFSKKPIGSVDNKVGDKESKETPKESLPRNYGDNLIRDEMKKSEESKDVKVTSIEISEIPRHKTRHHHGEWPKRDYSHRHQS